MGVNVTLKGARDYLEQFFREYASKLPNNTLLLNQDEEQYTAILCGAEPMYPSKFSNPNEYGLVIPINAAARFSSSYNPEDKKLTVSLHTLGKQSALEELFTKTMELAHPRGTRHIKFEGLLVERFVDRRYSGSRGMIGNTTTPMLANSQSAANKILPSQYVAVGEEAKAKMISIIQKPIPQTRRKTVVKQ